MAKPKTTPIKKIALKDWNNKAPSHFIGEGLEYYIAGRFCFFAGCNFICSHLFHHAVEMIIKGYLSKTLSQSKVFKFRHRLDKLWRKFKNDIGAPELLKFDTVIAELDKFERIRYPDKIVLEGYFMRWSLTDNNPPIAPSTHRNMPVYETVLSQIDELIHALFKHSGINVRAYSGIIHESGLEILNRQNKWPYN
jgi:hypothetical protein